MIPTCVKTNPFSLTWAGTMENDGFHCLKIDSAVHRGQQSEKGAGLHLGGVLRAAARKFLKKVLALFLRFYTLAVIMSTLPVIAAGSAVSPVPCCLSFRITLFQVQCSNGAMPEPPPWSQPPGARTFSTTSTTTAETETKPI